MAKVGASKLTGLHLTYWIFLINHCRGVVRYKLRDVRDQKYKFIIMFSFRNALRIQYTKFLGTPIPNSPLQNEKLKYLNIFYGLEQPSNFAE